MSLPGITGFGYSSGSRSSSQDIWGPQAAQLRALYGQAGSFFNQPNPYLQNALTSGEQAMGQMNPYLQSAMPAWNSLLGGGTFGGQQFDVSGVNPIATGTAPAFDTLNSLQNPMGNPYLDQMAGSGLNNLYQQYSQNVMPAIGNSAEMGGGLGGSRQGIAQGLATQGLLDSSSDYLTNLYGGQYQSDMDRALQAADVSLGQQLGGIGAAGQLGMGADQTGLNALGQGQNAVNLGFTGPNLWSQLYGMQWNPYQMFGSILGNPIALTSSKGKETGFKLGF